MFHPTKTQTSLALCGALLVGGASYLRAQSNYPAPAKTPEAAAQAFYRLLDVASAPDKYRRDGIFWEAYNPGSTSKAALASLLTPVSRPQLERMDKALGVIVPLDLLVSMAARRDEKSSKFRVAGTNGAQTLVEMAPTPLRVVTIPEDGGYRVDLKATYGGWNGLSGVKLDAKWFELSGVATPLLRADPMWMGALEKRRRASCQTNLKQQALAVLQYSQDYDEKLPPARRWVDVLKPYAQTEEIFKCPALKATGSQGFGYAFNQYLSQKPYRAVADRASTMLIYETSNPARNWFGDGTGRVYRHGGGSNIAFADGHIKWYKEGAEPGVKFKPVFTIINRY